VRQNMRDLAAKLQAQGWKVDKWPNGHYKLVPSDKRQPIITASFTPSDWRGWRNRLADLRRAGAKV